MTCKSCDSNCLNCKSTTGNCSQCKINFGVNGINCTACQNGTYSDGFGPCMNCSVSNCLICNGS